MNLITPSVFSPFCRFLESSQLNEEGTEVNENELNSQYEREVRILHEMIQHKVSAILSDPCSAVKETLLHNGLTTLCVFFGKQKGNLEKFTNKFQKNGFHKSTAITNFVG